MYTLITITPSDKFLSDKNRTQVDVGDTTSSIAVANKPKEPIRGFYSNDIDYIL